MSELKIEKNVPVPNGFRNGRNKSEFTKLIDSMEIGDSILLPDESVTSTKAIIYQAKNRSGILFSVRKVDGGKYRAWRIA